MRVFVSVGTTEFQGLIDVFNDNTVIKAMQESGVTFLTIQHGTSKFVAPRDTGAEGLSIHSFDYAPTLEPFLEQADVVISHAATGIWLNASRFCLPHFLVVNNTLHENHQADLAGMFDGTGRCRAFAGPDQFRSYLLSDNLENDVCSMRSAAPNTRAQTPPQLLAALTKKPSTPGMAGLVVLAGIALFLCLTRR